uniref:RING-type E3 ubiquitin transferase n=2 Tax=Lygus hesperus TaxID=30085 RepID=A0A0A9W5W5_LYGHE
MEVGLRVVRGPDWKWDDQDGGEGSVGTVVAVGKSGTKNGTPDKTVVVCWDIRGYETNYRVGYDSSYDLRMLDNAPTGVRHPLIICNSCRRQGVEGLRFQCFQCNDYDLCMYCYMDDKHDTCHPFLRYDSPSSNPVTLPPREGSEKRVLRGIFVGAKVVRGKNWEWGDQDGGCGRSGRVLDIKCWENETWRSVVNVAWTTGSTNIYRMGHKGKVDLKCEEPASPGTYYPEHLPIVGKELDNDVPRPELAPLQQFTIGERVKVAVEDIEALKRMQEGHGGWNDRMCEVIGVLGRVHRVTDKGDIRVFYPRLNSRWTINPRALAKVPLHIEVGDVIRVSSDKNMVAKLQVGHGEWIQAMSSILGKVGMVMKVYGDGDLRVLVDGQTWTLNPLVVHPLSEGPGGENQGDVTPSQPTHSANMSALLSNMMEEQLDLSTTPNIHVIVRDAAQGHLNIVRDFFTQNPDKIDAKSASKTCLQVASHQGHIAIVKQLIAAGANVKITDDEGDTPLHYAAFGNQSAVMEVLLEAGADVNAVNINRCTALHIAVSKKHVSCVESVFKFKPNVNIQDNYGDTALHDAIGNYCSEAIQLITECPSVDLDLRNKRGFNALHHAALKGNTFATERLIAVNRQLTDIKKNDGFSALHLAALNGHKTVAEVLVNLGKASIDLANNRKQTPLMLAVSQGHAGVVELLVENGASLEVADEDGDTALHMALLKANTIAVELDPVNSPETYRIHEEMKRRKYFVPPSPARTAKEEEENNKDKGFKGEALAIAAYLVQEGADLIQENNKGESSASIAGEERTEQLISFIISEQERAKRRAHRHAAECLVCSEMSSENVLLEPCGHRVACEDCSSRMKKCLTCQELISKRIGKDGKTIAYKPRRPSAEALRYLETKIAEIEEVHCCGICMERRRNVVFLCGHSACDKCSAELTVCHMCRTTIANKIHLYV